MALLYCTCEKELEIMANLAKALKDTKHELLEE